MARLFHLNVPHQRVRGEHPHPAAALLLILALAILIFVWRELPPVASLLPTRPPG